MQWMKYKSEKQLDLPNFQRKFFLHSIKFAVVTYGCENVQKWWVSVVLVW